MPPASVTRIQFSSEQLTFRDSRAGFSPGWPGEGGATLGSDEI